MAETPSGPGTVLAGRYLLEDLLEEASGAKFWRATDQILARSVAVHVIAADDPRAEALLSAARTSAAVTDPHFLRVLDAAEEDGLVYVVNEWGSGMSLDRMLADGPLPPRRAAWVVMEVAEAITAAHRHGVAHGRLLPENVMVSEAGSVKLIGFVVDAALHEPEVAQTGGAIPDDHAQDVMNLAALLYATLVGKWPGSAGSSLPDAPRDHGRALRLRQVRAGIPRPLDTICDRVLNAEYHPHAMPVETAHEIGAALSDFIGDLAGTSQGGYEPTSGQHREDLTAGADPDEEPSEGEHESDQAGVPPAQVPTTDSQAADSQATLVGVPPIPDAPELPDAPDPEATQAGAPSFFDDDTGAGAMSWGQSRDLRGDDPGNLRRPAPPPDLLEPEPRPLFAPDPPGGRVRRGYPNDPGPVAHPRDQGTPVGRPGYGTTYSTGPGTGSLPAVWGPDDIAAAPDDDAAWGGGDSGKSWLQLAAIVGVCLVLLVAIIIAFNLGRGSDEPSGTPSNDTSGSNPPTGEVLDIAGVQDFDPQGDPPEENPELAPLAIDGDPGTAWHSLTYQGNPQLGLLKDGVGLVVDLGEPADVAEVRLTLIGSPTSLQILAADEGASAPTTVDGLTRVASANDAGESVDLVLRNAVTTRYLVVWLTSLPPLSGGYQGQIAEISVRS